MDFEAEIIEKTGIGFIHPVPVFTFSLSLLNALKQFANRHQFIPFGCQFGY